MVNTPVVNKPESGHGKRQMPEEYPAQGMEYPRRDADCLKLFHPDYTVGSGISPDLLTSASIDHRRSGALAGSPKQLGIPPVGNFTLP
jgi:hypothetical protein